MRLLPFIFLPLLLLSPGISGDSYAADKMLSEERLVIQVIQLDYADAEHLSSVVAPLLSPEGRVVAYSPTNSLIIKDRASVVRRLVEIIKGPLNQ
jgi:type II secretory pathway component GspD/PulD (secretin)